jgi:hypothetical protein
MSIDNECCPPPALFNNLTPSHPSSDLRLVKISDAREIGSERVDIGDQKRIRRTVLSGSKITSRGRRYLAIVAE